MAISFLHIFSNKYLKYNILDLFTYESVSARNLSSKENIKDDMFSKFDEVFEEYCLSVSQTLFSKHKMNLKTK